MIIYSYTYSDLLKHLEETLERIQSAGLTLNTGKCRWSQQETSYLRYVYSGQWSAQTTSQQGRGNPAHLKEEVRSFLGLIGWYRRFIHEFATLATPLTELLTKAVKNPLPWTEECKAAFQNLKNRLCSRSVLQSPNFSR